MLDRLGRIHRTVGTAIWDEGERGGRGEKEGGCTHTHRVQSEFALGDCLALLPKKKGRNNSGINY